jgi:hypothetical protein
MAFLRVKNERSVTQKALCVHGRNAKKEVWKDIFGLPLS